MKTLKAKIGKQAARKILGLLGLTITGSIQAGIAAAMIVESDDDARQAVVYTHPDLAGVEVIVHWEDEA